MRIDEAYSVAQLRKRAKRVLPKPLFDFADGAALDEVTRGGNEAAFQQARFAPQPLNGVADPDLSVELFGAKLSMPLMIGPTGLSGLFWPDGELATARAAKNAGIGQCLSHGSCCTIEELAETGLTPRWMQVFVYKDRGFTQHMVERAEASNYDALVLTIDNQVLSKRERDLANGFKIPPRFDARQMAAMATKWGWLKRMTPRLKDLTFANYTDYLKIDDFAELAGQMSTLLDPGMSWDDVAWLRKMWRGPLILKGVIHPDEAVRAMNEGVDGIIVSNHGGRQLDGAIASRDALEPIAERIAERMPILVDGGVRRGHHILDAMQAGATACLIGRPTLWGLSVAGEAGVTRVLQILREELALAVGLNGGVRRYA